MTRRLPARCRALCNSALAASIPQPMHVVPSATIASIREWIVLKLLLKLRSIGSLAVSAKLTNPH
jgi:hypothetical protein